MDAYMRVSIFSCGIYYIVTVSSIKGDTFRNLFPEINRWLMVRMFLAFLNENFIAV